MEIEIINYGGWPDTLRIFNNEAELLVTTNVGPRIISYRIGDQKNVFHIAENELGSSGEADWKIRGGHRLWLAPEDMTLSYHADNHSVAWRRDNDEVVIESLQNNPSPIRKILGVRLAQNGPQVAVRHTIVNEGLSPIRLAIWGLSVMRGGGVAIIPQPPMGTHPRDFLPNRTLILWPYTQLNDPRWIRGENHWLLHQKKNFPPLKFGLAHAQRHIAYANDGSLFVKTFDLIPEEIYPDNGSNFETFVNADFLEIESLGPLKTLHPGESTSHTETWNLFATKNPPPLHEEPALTQWLTTYFD